MVLVVKNLAANAGDLRDVGLIPGLGRSPGEGQGNPLQYSCLDNPMDRGAWRATVHGVRRVECNLSTKPPPHNRMGIFGHVILATAWITSPCSVITSWVYVHGHWLWTKLFTFPGSPNSHHYQTAEKGVHVLPGRGKNLPSATQTLKGGAGVTPEGGPPPDPTSSLPDVTFCIGKDFCIFAQDLQMHDNKGIWTWSPAN